MSAIFFIVGWLVVGAVGLRVLIEAVSAFRRHALDEQRRRISIELFRARAQLDLAAAKAELARTLGTWSGWRKFEIDSKVEEARDVVSFYLKPHDGLPAAPFLPGQHLKFQAGIPGQDRPVVRCYSLSDRPGNLDSYRITVKRASARSPDHAPGLMSNYLIDQTQEGDLLNVGAPSGHFHLDLKSQRPLVLIGAGVGLTPLVSMLNYLDDDHWVQDVYFFYGARNREEHPMKEELERLAAKNNRLRLITAYSRPTGRCRPAVDFQADGHITRALLSHYLPSNQFEFYLCGPSAMMDDLVPALEDWGVPKQDIHFEAFGPSSVRRGGIAVPEAEDTEVFFARSEERLIWKGESSLLELAIQNGIKIDSGCAAGSCGSCLTAIKEGKVRYLAEPGELPEAGSCLPCVCIPDGRLALDA